MKCDNEPEQLPLFEAFQKWVDEMKITFIRVEERRHSMLALNQRPEPLMSDGLGRPQAAWRTHFDDDRNFTTFEQAWALAERDFRQQVERKQLFLAGHLVTDAMSAELIPLPGELVAVLKINWKDNTIWYRNRQFAGVLVRKTPFAPTRTELPHAALLQRPGRIEDIPELSDEMILALLEAHADRVVASKDPNFIVPSKVSVMPIIRRKMEYRHAHNEMQGTLIKEAQALEEWIQRALPSYQTPKAPAIKNSMSLRYAALKA